MSGSLTATVLRDRASFLRGVEGRTRFGCVYVLPRDVLRCAELLDNGASVVESARGVVSYWDSLDAVLSDDPRATELFAAEMDRRINQLRRAMEAT